MAACSACACADAEAERDSALLANAVAGVSAADADSTSCAVEPAIAVSVDSADEAALGTTSLPTACAVDAEIEADAALVDVSDDADCTEGTVCVQTTDAGNRSCPEAAAAALSVATTDVALCDACSTATRIRTAPCAGPLIVTVHEYVPAVVNSRAKIDSWIEFPDPM